jgi:hypothetical protein
MLRRCDKFGGHLKDTGQMLYRYTGGMTLTLASKGNTGDPGRKLSIQVPETSGKKKSEVSQKEGLLSSQEVGLDHSSDEDL